MQDEVLSLQKVADLTGVPPASIRYYCKKGELKAKKEYGRWEVRMSDLLAFAQMREQKAKGRADEGDKKEKLGNENCRV